MERKYQIRPVTVLKVKGFLQDVTLKIRKGDKFSMDGLATEHRVSGSMGTALTKMGFIRSSPEKHGVYLSVKPFQATEKMAIQILEFIRLRNIQMKKEKDVMLNNPLLMDVPLSADHSSNMSSKSGNDITLKLKSFKTAEIKPTKPKDQIDIFDGIKNVYEERLAVCSAIATGVYSGRSELISRLTDEDIKLLNQRILYAGMDLMDQILNFKTIK